MLKEQGEEVHLARARLEDRAAIQKDLLEFRPRYVLNVAGIVRAHLFLFLPASLECCFVERCKLIMTIFICARSLQTGRPNVDYCEDHKQETTRYRSRRPLHSHSAVVH
jgi:hypothetical protein